MNRIDLLGRTTKDVELTFTKGSGLAVARVTIAIDNYNSKTKEKSADFIPVVAFGKRAETLANYVAKGEQVAITGHLHSGSYENDKGEKRYTLEVIVDSLYLLNNGKKKQAENEDLTPVDDKDIPF